MDAGAAAISVAVTMVVGIALAILVSFLSVRCPNCRNTQVNLVQSAQGGTVVWKCRNCGRTFSVY